MCVYKSDIPNFWYEHHACKEKEISGSKPQIQIFSYLLPINVSFNQTLFK